MTVTLSTALLQVLIGTVLPMAVAVVTHQMASSRYKAVVLTVLSVVAGVATQMLRNNGHLVVGQAALLSAVSFAVAYVAHAGLLKPLGLTGSAGAIARTMPAGLGLRRTSMGRERSPRH